MVERHLAKVDVVSSNLIARSSFLCEAAAPSGLFRVRVDRSSQSTPKRGFNLNSEMETTDCTDCTDSEWLVDGGDSIQWVAAGPVSIFFEISKICEI